MTQELIKALANPTNQAILSLLAVEPAYPRKVADLLSIGESDASRRLRQLQEVGLVGSEWTRLDDRNVKTYRLVVDDVSIDIRGEGLEVSTTRDGDGDDQPTLVDRLQVRVPDPDDFVGRRGELEAIGGPEPVVLVEGIAGIGKTSLAAAWARDEQGETPVFFHSFSGTESLTWLAHRVGVFRAAHGDRELLEAAENGAPIADQRELLLRALNDDASAAVFDAVERIRDESVENLVSTAIERVDEGKVVVTGRSIPHFDPTVDHVRRLRLSGLPPGDVARLLEERGLEAERAIAKRIQRRLGGHPLAINLFTEAAAEAEGSPASLLDQVPEEEIETYLLEEVLDHVSDAERQTLTYASVFRGPFRSEEVEAVHPRDPRGALVKLRRRRLLRRDGEAYRMHDLLRSFLEQRLDDPAAVHAEAAEQALSKGTLEARLDALYHLLEAGKRDRVLGLLEEDLDLEEFDLVEEGYHNLYLDVLEQLDTQQIADDHRAGLVYDELGDIRYHRGEYERALERYRQALKHFSTEEAGDRLADLAWKRGLVLRELDRPEQAAEIVQEGLEDEEADERTSQRLEALAEELGVAD